MSSYLLFFAAGDFDRITKRPAGARSASSCRAATARRRSTRSTPRRRSCPTTTIISARPSRCPSSTTSPARASRILRRDGELGRDLHLRTGPARRSGDHQREPAPRRSSRSRRTRWRTSGSATSSPWPGGTTSGSTRASPAGWRTRPPQHFHPDWGADVDRVASREEAMGARLASTTHPVVQQVRTVEQANQAFDTITYQKGESVISMLEGFAAPTCGGEASSAYMRQACLSEHAHRPTSGPQSRAPARKRPDRHRHRLHDPAGHSADHRRPVAVRRRTHRADADADPIFRRPARAPAARPLTWRVPVRASAGGAVARSSRLAAPRRYHRRLRAAGDQPGSVPAITARSIRRSSRRPCRVHAAWRGRPVWPMRMAGAVAGGVPADGGGPRLLDAVPAARMESRPAGRRGMVRLYTT